MSYLLSDFGDRQTRSHATLSSAEEAMAMLDELLAGEPRVWELRFGNEGSGITFAAGGGMCGLVQWSIEGGPPWWFLVAKPEGAEPFSAQWSGAPWQVGVNDVVDVEVLRRVITTFMTTEGKRDPDAKWDKVEE